MTGFYPHHPFTTSFLFIIDHDHPMLFHNHIVIYCALARKRCWEEVPGSCQSPNLSISVSIYLFTYLAILLCNSLYIYLSISRIYLWQCLLLHKNSYLQYILPTFRRNIFFCENKICDPKISPIFMQYIFINIAIIFRNIYLGNIEIFRNGKKISAKYKTNIE